jgi:hypothetical protein
MIDGYGEIIPGQESTMAMAMAPQIIAASDSMTTDCFREEAEVSQIIRFEIFDFRHQYKLPDPAPPPKLHYSTFWRSVTRRIYHKMYLDV